MALPKPKSIADAIADLSEAQLSGDQKKHLTAARRLRDISISTTEAEFKGETDQLKKVLDEVIGLLVTNVSIEKENLKARSNERKVKIISAPEKASRSDLKINLASITEKSEKLLKPLIKEYKKLKEKENKKLDSDLNKLYIQRDTKLDSQVVDENNTATDVRNRKTRIGKEFRKKIADRRAVSENILLGLKIANETARNEIYNTVAKEKTKEETKRKRFLAGHASRLKKLQVLDAEDNKKTEKVLLAHEKNLQDARKKYASDVTKIQSELENVIAKKIADSDAQLNNIREGYKLNSKNNKQNKSIDKNQQQIDAILKGIDEQIAKKDSVEQERSKKAQKDKEELRARTLKKHQNDVAKETAKEDEAARKLADKNQKQIDTILKGIDEQIEKNASDAAKKVDKEQKKKEEILSTNKKKIQEDLEKENKLSGGSGFVDTKEKENLETLKADAAKRIEFTSILNKAYKTVFDASSSCKNKLDSFADKQKALDHNYALYVQKPKLKTPKSNIENIHKSLVSTKKDIEDKLKEAGLSYQSFKNTYSNLNALGPVVSNELTKKFSSENKNIHGLLDVCLRAYKEIKTLLDNAENILGFVGVNTPNTNPYDVSDLEKKQKKIKNFTEYAADFDPIAAGLFHIVGLAYDKILGKNTDEQGNPKPTIVDKAKSKKDVLVSKVKNFSSNIFGFMKSSGKSSSSALENSDVNQDLATSKSRDSREIDILLDVQAKVQDIYDIIVSQEQKNTESEDENKSGFSKRIKSASSGIPSGDADSEKNEASIISSALQFLEVGAGLKATESIGKLVISKAKKLFTKRALSTAATVASRAALPAIETGAAAALGAGIATSAGVTAGLITTAAIAGTVASGAAGYAAGTAVNNKYNVSGKLLDTFMSPTGERSNSTSKNVKGYKGKAAMPDETIKSVIKTASDKVGVDFSTMLAIAQKESSFNPNAKAKTSSAKGLYQFLDGTFYGNSKGPGIIQKYSSQYPELKAGSSDPMASAIAGALYIKENSAVLKRAGIETTAGNIYALHFLGAGAGPKFLSAPENAIASDLFPSQASSNPTVFRDFTKNRERTIGEVKSILFGGVQASADKFAGILNAGTSMVASSTTNNTSTSSNVTSSSPVMVAEASPTISQTSSTTNNTSTSSNVTSSSPVMVAEASPTISQTSSTTNNTSTSSNVTSSSPVMVAEASPISSQMQKNVVDMQAANQPVYQNTQSNVSPSAPRVQYSGSKESNKITPKTNPPDITLSKVNQQNYILSIL